MSKQPETLADAYVQKFRMEMDKSLGFIERRVAERSAGNALHERLEHWIQMNSGICDPKDVEAIEAWKKATQ